MSSVKPHLMDQIRSRSSATQPLLFPAAAFFHFLRHPNNPIRPSPVAPPSHFSRYLSASAATDRPETILQLSSQVRSTPP